MSRTDKTERIGVNAVEEIVLNEFQWIFREQPNPDFGIDALIELDNSDYPTGKLIALQIKTGRSHVNIGERVLTYSTSWVHYHYWLSSNVPVVFVIHFPKTGKTYWQHITKTNFKRARKRMVLQIPKKQKFNGAARTQFEKILQTFKPESSHFRILKGNIRPNTIDDALVGIKYIPKATKCLYEIANIMEGAGRESKAKTKIFKGFIEQELFDNNSQVKAQIDDWGIVLNIASKELEHQKDLFSEYFSFGFTSYQELLSEIAKINYPYDFDLSKSVLTELSILIPNTISQIESLQTTVSKIPTKYPVLREAKITLSAVLNMIIIEFNVVRLISKKIIHVINDF